MKKLLTISIGAAVLCCVASVVSTSSAAEPTTGTWYSYPAQTFTTSEDVTQGFSYQTAVRPPINADGSSNWSSRRGVIPVQFDLLTAPSTTTTTTKTYDPPVWESLNESPNVIVPGSWSYAGLLLSPGLTLNQITNLSANYLFTTGTCQGGSLRWTLRVNVEGVNRLLHIYYGTPNGPDQGCSGSNSGSGQNLITTGITPNRFEMPGGWGVPGPVYTTWTDVLASTHDGNDIVDRAQLTLDSGWNDDQVADVSNVTVNENTWVPKTTETTRSTVDGPYGNTCTLPAAELRWAKNDATPNGAINEGQSIQPRDTGLYFRQVDCKYIYNLDVTSLDGAGTYTVWARIDGVNVPLAAAFDLK